MNAQLKTGQGRSPVNGSKRWSYIGTSHNPTFVICYGSATHFPTSEWIDVGENEIGGLMFTGF